MFLRFRRLIVLAIAWLPSASGHISAQTADKTAKPNIVFILVDDWRWNCLGCMGDKVARTPHIDKLAARGTLFRNSFVTTSICAVSRASILSGQWQRRHGIKDFSTGFKDDKWAATYVALLRMAGYRLGFIGKFGVGSAQQIMARAGAFQFWRGRPGQAGTHFIDKNDPTRTHLTARFGNEALEFLRGCRPGEPF
jgi:arylsulfatase A-like enzyme